MENNIIFFLKYGTEEHAVELPKFDTVEILKINVHKMYGIPLHQQIIEGWKKTPEGNNDILQSCADVVDINYLTIRLADLSAEEDSDNESEEEVMEQYVADDEQYMKKGREWLKETVDEHFEEDVYEHFNRNDAEHLVRMDELFPRMGDENCSGRRFDQQYLKIEKNIIFFLKYGTEEHAFELPEFDTVEILKINVHKMYGIPLHQQIIEGWKKTPEGNNDILQSCADVVDINYLTIRLADLSAEEDSDNESEEEVMEQYVAHDEQYMKKGREWLKETVDEHFEEDVYEHFNRNDAEHLVRMDELFPRMGDENCSGRRFDPNAGLEAAFSCYEKIEGHCRNFAGQFHIVSLVDAVAESCLTSLEKRKVLLLYLHNGNEEFSKIFFKNLRNPKVVKILDSSFFMLGWDVENSDYHNDLEDALDEFDLSHLVSLVRCKSCAAVLIQNINGCITVNSCLMGNTSDRDFLTSLENVATFLNSEKLEERELENLERKAGNENDMDSTKYQKLMADMLGDRDYDCFEFDQHDELKQKIAYAMFGPPQKESGHDEKAMKKVEVVYRSIMNSSNEIAKYIDQVEISFIYNCTEPLPTEKLSRAKKYKDYNPNTDLMPLPIFILRKCRNSQNPCRIFIDDTGRTYQSWMEYIAKNKLHECKMVLPHNGRYKVNEQGEVHLEHHLSPACGLDVKILQGVDIASTGMGLASGGVFIAAAITSITIAPALLITAGAVGILTGGYAIGRSIHTLIDRSKHKETLSFANSEARGAYLNIVAGSLGFVGAGTNVVVSKLATNGINIGKGAGAVVNTIGFANLGASGVSVLNTGYDVLDRWINENQTPSMLTIVQLSSSILFFGNAVYNFKSCSTIVEESQTRALQNYQESLRSNRHRKTFNNLTKETILRNDGNTVQGRAEVIAAIRNISNKDEVFAALTRNKKTLNQNGVKFYANGGDITLNGQPINLNEFTSLGKKDVSSFLSNIPPKTIVSPSEVSFMQRLLANIQHSLPNFENLVQYAVRVLGSYDGNIQKLVVKAVVELLALLNVGIVKTLEEIFPNHNKYVKLLNMVIEYFGTAAMDLDKQYKQWRSTGSSQYYEPWFKDVDGDASNRCVWFFEKAVTICFSGGNLREIALKELLSYFNSWFTQQVFENVMKKESAERRSAHSARSRRVEVSCTVCRGHFYRKR